MMFDTVAQAEVDRSWPLLDSGVTPRVPARLVFNPVGVSNPLRERLFKQGIELVCPQRKGCFRLKTQDGRKARYDHGRHGSEHTIARLHAWERLVDCNGFCAFL